MNAPDRSDLLTLAPTAGAGASIVSKTTITKKG